MNGRHNRVWPYYSRLSSNSSDSCLNVFAMNRILAKTLSSENHRCCKTDHLICVILIAFRSRTCSRTLGKRCQGSRPRSRMRARAGHEERHRTTGAMIMNYTQQQNAGLAGAGHCNFMSGGSPY
jgi:hypothetical protein